MKAHEPTEFTKSVVKLIKSIPKGRVTRQSRMLEAEGVEIKDGKTDLLIFGWKKKPPIRKKAVS